MADVISHHPLQVAFHNRPVNHAPSPLGFGFGLSAPLTTSSSSNTHLIPWNMPAITPGIATQPRIMKRRHEQDEDDTKHDDAMDRSPTPERPKRAVPKRARTTPSASLTSKDDRTTKDNKGGTNDGNDVDVGVLLASLPPESLLPLLSSLISAHPALKTSVLSLIPRPSLDTATHAIVRAAKKLLDAFPYSTATASSAGFGSATSFSIGGAGFGNMRSPPFGSAPGFTSTSFGQPSQSSHHTAGMRDEYIVSRLRPHIQEFVSACFSYLPYFSYVDISMLSSLDKAHSVPHAQSHASALQSQHRDKYHPSETYLFLEAVTTQIAAQPPLTQSSLVPLLIPRLTQEWKAWVDRVDQLVNREGGMFGHETVQRWEKGLDELAQAQGSDLEVMREIRDRWVSKVGWLVGRQPMKEVEY